MIVANTLAAETLSFETRPVPELTTGTALIKVEHVTLCGTDLHIWEGEYLNPFPIVQGHEFVGRIHALAEPHAVLGPGDRVVVSPMRYCRECHACRTGRHNVCERVSVLGCYEDGALSEYVLAPVDSLWTVPEGVPGELAPLSEPASIAMQAVRRGRPREGELALVIGCGPIGIIATRYLRDLGVDVVAVDTLAARTATAWEFGASGTLVIDATAPFPSAVDISTASDDEPRPVTLVIEATGSPAAFAAALDVAAPTGRVVAVGISDRKTQIPLRTIPLKELDVMGSRNSLELIGEGLALIERHRPLFASLLSHRFGFEELERALEVMRTDSANVRKVLVTMDGVI